jgi:hypothetical protein
MGRFLRMATILLVTLPLLGVAAGAKQARHRVAAVVDTRLGLVLGGSVDGRWADDARVARLLRGGERYRLYTLTKHLGSAVGTKPEHFNGEGFDEAHLVKLKPEPGEDCIAILGGRDALPRAPKAERTDQRVYQEAVRSILKRHGLSPARVDLTQVLRVDLEGDGVDEVLISANNQRENRLSFMPSKGDYCLVLLRKVVRGKVRTVVLDQEYFLKGGEEEHSAAMLRSVPAVLDVNGDGVMEVFVQWDYYEGTGKDVYAVNGSRVKRVFGQGWGV